MKCAYSSNIGVKRRVNQDAYLAAAIENNGEQYYVFAVADGLGGRLAGEVASQEAVDYIREHLSKIENYYDYMEMDRFVGEMNEAIIAKSLTDPDYRGMATTLTMAILRGDAMVIIHIGDSRAYRISAEGIEQLTKDHSLVQVLVDEGKLTSEEAKHHPRKNVITRALGTDNAVHIDLYKYRVKSGDKVLLCSDGLYNLVEDEDIQKIVTTTDLESAAKELVDLANANGGTDNITLVIFNPEEEVEASDR